MEVQRPHRLARRVANTQLERGLGGALFIASRHSGPMSPPATTSTIIGPPPPRGWSLEFDAPAAPPATNDSMVRVSNLLHAWTSSIVGSGGPSAEPAEGGGGEAPWSSAIEGRDHLIDQELGGMDPAPLHVSDCPCVGHGIENESPGKTLRRSVLMLVVHR